MSDEPTEQSAADLAAAEAQRIKLAGMLDPMLAVASRDVRSLPHQIRAEYGESLPRTPLRFLLADDPGAGRTIMKGVYAEELRLRDDVKRCLVAEKKGLAKDALSFTALAQSWPDIVAESRATNTATAQGSFAFDTEDDAR